MLNSCCPSLAKKRKDHKESQKITKHNFEHEEVTVTGHHFVIYQIKDIIWFLGYNFENPEVTANTSKFRWMCNWKLTLRGLGIFCTKPAVLELQSPLEVWGLFIFPSKVWLLRPVGGRAGQLYSGRQLSDSVAGWNWGAPHTTLLCANHSSYSSLKAFPRTLCKVYK